MFICETCEKEFTKNSKLQQHIKAVHLKIKDIKCQECDYKCSEKINLQQHIKQVHLKIRDFECQDCNFKCSKKGDLQKHIKAVHDKIKDFECQECDFKFSENSTLQRHLLICTGTNKRFSGGEYQIVKALQDVNFFENEDYYFDLTFSELTDYCGKNLRPDFRFIKHKIMIEYDGIQHFEPKTFGGISQEQAEEKFKETQENDRIKDQFCKDNDYKMIRISYKDFPNILSILTTELHDIIDWYG